MTALVLTFKGELPEQKPGSMIHGVQTSKVSDSSWWPT